MPQVSKPQPSSSQVLRVDPDDLSDSANRIDRLVTELKSSHEAAHGRIEAAQAGQVGLSGVALKALVTKWQADTTALVEQLTTHGQAFRSAATAYRETDARAACTIKNAGNEANPGSQL